MLISGGTPDYRSVLDVAVDIARGMRHLHASHIIHADLKVWRDLQKHPQLPLARADGCCSPPPPTCCYCKLSIASNRFQPPQTTSNHLQAANVLLKSCNAEARGFTAKVCDFVSNHL